MKKYLIILFLFLISALNHNLYSQSLYIGFKGGLNFANMLEKSDYGDFSDMYKFMPGYNIGLLLESPVSGGIGGESGIYLNTRGYKFDEGDVVNGVKGTFRTLWIEVPFKATTATMVGPFTFYASGGASGSLGLSGTIDMDVTVNGTTTSITNDIVWGDDPEDADLLRIDYGAIGSVGVEFKSVILEASYYHGLANLSPYTEDGYVISSRYFAILLGYKFGL
ncbi:MAG: outer membrane beta-barrel protein [Bacteroidota bacterium]|nr:outer membrane beta-barrel protein [Bacteroidota bacterium]